MKLKMGLSLCFFLCLGIVIFLRFSSVPSHEPKTVEAFPACLPGPTGQPDQGLFPCPVLQGLRQEYIEKIAPVFATKCLLCHGEAERLPLYSKLPFISRMIRLDRREAKEALDMRQPFPFLGQSNPEVQLEKLQEVVSANSMPPWQFRLMHWRSGLTPAEQQEILKWIKTSLQKLDPSLE